MKKKISISALILLLMLSLFGCGSKTAKDIEYHQEQMNANVNTLIEKFSSMTEEEFQTFEDMSDFQLSAALLFVDLPVEGEDFLAMVEAWRAGINECGELLSVNERTFSAQKGGAEISIDADFKNRTAKIVFTFDEKMNITGMSVNAHYSISEILKKAGLNTILGMGTVFVVLIFISFIIYLFKYIPLIEKKFSRKAKAPQAAQPAEVSNAKETAVGEEDDLELAAVIAAAIAASEGMQPEGFVVRSIKRRKSNKWR